MDKMYLLSKICDIMLTRHGRHRSNSRGLFISVSVLSLLLSSFNVGLTPIVEALRNRHGSFSVISAKPCHNALGQTGTCMFMWDCIKSEGLHLGTCSDRFLFGSCCQHNTTNNNELSDQNKLNATASYQKPSLVDSQVVIPYTAPITGVTQSPLASITTSSIATSTTPPSRVQTRPTRPFLQSTSTLSNQVFPNSQINSLTTTTSTTSNSLQVTTAYDSPLYTRHNISLESANMTLNSLIQSDTWPDKPSSTQLTSSEHVISTTNNSSSRPQQVEMSEQIITNGVQTSPASIYSDQISDNKITLNQTSGDQGNEALINNQQQASSLLSGYQTSSKPLAHITTTTTTTTPTSIYMNPLAPAQNQPTNQIPQQQSKPQTLSWLSRPGIIANAIFHSFKPYLSPSRLRPIYKPYINPGYKPQNYRPYAAQFQPPRPINNVHEQMPSHQPFEEASTNNAATTNYRPSMPNTSSVSSDQSPNTDHHIVNPSTSSMTDRHRPIDKNQVGNDVQQMQKNGVYEGQINSTINHQQVTADDNFLSRPFNATDIVNGPQMSLSSSSNSILSQETLSNNFTKNHTLHKHPQTASNETVLGSILTASHSQGTNFPSYPLVPDFTNHIDQLPGSGSIDEIHGLSTVGSSSSSSSSTTTTTTTSDHKPELTQTFSNTPTHTTPSPISHSVAQLNNSQIYTFSRPPSSHHDSQFSSNSYPPGFDTTTLAPGTVLIGNIDDPPITVSSGSEQESSSHISVPANINFTVTPPAQPMNVIKEPPPSWTTSTVPGGSILTQTTFTTPLPNVIIEPNKQTNTTSEVQSIVPQIRDPLNKEVACGVMPLYPQTKVVGGKNAAFGAWPWQVSVRKMSFGILGLGFHTVHRCGGAVINSEWIATAGHCVEDLALQSIKIRVGEYDFSSTTEPYPYIERSARKKVVHPMYNFYTYENDLALIQLDKPIKFPPHVAPICLPPDNHDLVGKNATVTGWGRLSDSGTLPMILQEVRVPIISNEKCQKMFSKANRSEYIPDIFLCAGYEEGGRDSCQGDSGGPLQVRGDDGKWFLAGIISWGIGCAEQNLPGVCTRISRFKLWIQSTINPSGG